MLSLTVHPHANRRRETVAARRLLLHRTHYPTHHYARISDIDKKQYVSSYPCTQDINETHRSCPRLLTTISRVLVIRDVVEQDAPADQVGTEFFGDAVIPRVRGLLLTSN